jgi:hypothetical protein
MTLALRSDGASVRPDEALREILGERAADCQVVREELLVPLGGRWVDPLLAAAAEAAPRRATAGAV